MKTKSHSIRELLRLEEELLKAEKEQGITYDGVYAPALSVNNFDSAQEFLEAAGDRDFRCWISYGDPNYPCILVVMM